jgi:hypothetical protein
VSWRRYSIAAPVVRLTGNELGAAPTLPDLGREAEEWYRTKLQGTTAINLASGRAIRFGAAGRKRTASGKGEDILRLVPALRPIMEQGWFFGVPQPDKRGRAEVKAIHTLEVTVDLAGRPIDVVVVIREQADGEFYYDLRKDNRPGSRWAISEPSAEGLARKGQVPLPTFDGGSEAADWNIAIRPRTGKEKPVECW